MSGYWAHRTNKGRVIWARRTHLFSDRDVIRVFRGWIRPVEQASILAITETNFEIFLEAMGGIKTRTLGRVGEFVRDLIRRMFAQLLSVAEIQDADDLAFLSSDMVSWADLASEKAIALGSTATDAVAAVQEYLKEES